MRVLVTGSSGQLGREIARQLAGAHAVLGLDLHPGPRTTHTGSVADRDLVERLAAEVEAVVHCASLHAPHVGSREEPEFEEVNVEGTRVLLEAAAARGHARFVYTSTTSVYGDAMVPAPRRVGCSTLDRAVWVTEGLTPRPRDVYDRTKLAAEALCRQMAARGALRVHCLRVSRLFPERAEVVAGHRLHRGVDPRDAARAHVLSLASTTSGFEVLNISAPAPFSEQETAELWRDAPAAIERHHPGATEAFHARGWRLPARIDRVYVTARAESVLGFQPRYGLASLLEGPHDRWLYHLLAAEVDPGAVYSPPSLATEGFVHCSYRDSVRDSARLYFPEGAALQVLQIDPRRLGVAIEEAETPRGPMPHVFGPIQRDAIARVLRLEDVAGAPDSILGGDGALDAPRTLTPSTVGD